MTSESTQLARTQSQPIGIILTSACTVSFLAGASGEVKINIDGHLTCARIERTGHLPEDLAIDPATEEILNDENLMADLREAQADIQAGRLVDGDDVRRRG